MDGCLPQAKQGLQDAFLFSRQQVLLAAAQTMFLSENACFIRKRLVVLFTFQKASPGKATSSADLP